VKKTTADGDDSSTDAATTPRPSHLQWQPARGADATVVARARAWLRRALPRLLGHHPRAGLRDDTELLLSELVTNAVLHGGGVTTVRLRTIGKVLRVTVCDHAAAPPVAHDPLDQQDAEHGRGIFLIEALANRWGVHHRERADGKCVWLELSTVIPRRALTA
jgi:anti-sigma regulatory factor (Ser/Thr protein kinase)